MGNNIDLAVEVSTRKSEREIHVEWFWGRFSPASFADVESVNCTCTLLITANDIDKLPLHINNTWAEMIVPQFFVVGNCSAKPVYRKALLIKIHWVPNVSSRHSFTSTNYKNFKWPN
jgi:hypothetical protein